MKKILLIISFLFILTSCTSGRKTTVTELNMNNEKYNEILEFFNSIDKNKEISGIIKGEENYTLIFNNPNFKIDEVKVKYANDLMKIDLQGEDSENEPIKIYNIILGDDYRKNIDKESKNHSVVVERSGKEMKTVIIDAINMED